MPVENEWAKHGPLDHHSKKRHLHELSHMQIHGYLMYATPPAPPASDPDNDGDNDAAGDADDDAIKTP